MFLVIVWNTGAMRGCYNLSQIESESTVHTPREIKERAHRLQAEFWQQRYEEFADKPAGSYTVEMYFADMVKSRDIWCEETGNESEISDLFLGQNGLLFMSSQDNPSKARVDQARLIYLPDYNTRNPVSTKEVFTQMFKWLFGQYLVDIPFIVVLFWLWRIDFSDFKKYATTDARLVLAILLWPFVFIQMFCDKDFEALTFGNLDTMADRTQARIIIAWQTMQSQIAENVLRSFRAGVQGFAGENTFHYIGRLDQVILGPPEPIPWFRHCQ